MGAVSRGLDRIDATFDDPNLVANAGLSLVATLVGRLGLEAEGAEYSSGAVIRGVLGLARPLRSAVMLFVPLAVQRNES